MWANVLIKAACLGRPFCKLCTQKYHEFPILVAQKVDAQLVVHSQNSKLEQKAALIFKFEVPTSLQ